VKLVHARLLTTNTRYLVKSVLRPANKTSIPPGQFTPAMRLIVGMGQSSAPYPCDDPTRKRYRV
jgi:hypothetical protein